MAHRRCGRVIQKRSRSGSSYTTKKRPATHHELPTAGLVGEGGFEPPKSETTDLQSAPFGHSGIPPYSLAPPAGQRPGGLSYAAAHRRASDTIPRFSGLVKQKYTMTAGNPQKNAAKAADGAPGSQWKARGPAVPSGPGRLCPLPPLYASRAGPGAEGAGGLPLPPQMLRRPPRRMPRRLSPLSNPPKRIRPSVRGARTTDTAGALCLAPAAAGAKRAGALTPGPSSPLPGSRQRGADCQNQ